MSGSQPFHVIWRYCLAVMFHAGMAAQAQTSSTWPAASFVSTQVPHATGSAICVDPEGGFLTAWHVLKGREVFLLSPHGGKDYVRAKLAKIDEAQDLALLKADVPCQPVTLADWPTVPIGSQVFVLGYPTPNYLGRTLKITEGLISGVRHEGDALFQLSASVQKGNSGGAVLAANGTLVGMVLRKFDALKMAERNGDLVEAVSFAVHAQAICSFIASGEVSCGAKPWQAQDAQPSHLLYQQGLGHTWMISAHHKPAAN